MKVDVHINLCRLKKLLQSELKDNLHFCFQHLYTTCVHLQNPCLVVNSTEFLYNNFEAPLMYVDSEILCVSIICSQSDGLPTGGCFDFYIRNILPFKQLLDFNTF